MPRDEPTVRDGAAPADAAPRESDVVFRLLVEGVKDYAIYMLDPEGHIVSWNAGAEHLKGWRAEEVLGQHVSLFHPPESRALGKPEQELRVAREQGVFREEAWRLRKDGSRFIADVTLTALRDEAGRLRGFAKVTRDITARRQAEEARERLRETEERFRLLVEGVKDYAIFMLDPDGRIASWNPGAERMKGYRAGDILGRHFSVFYPPEEAAAGKPEQGLRIACEQGRYHEEGWRLRKDGSRFLADVTITPLRDESGVLRGFGKVTRDITERRRVEEEIRALARELEQRVEERTRQLQELNAELQSFAYTVAHDLRAPLRAMRGFSQALLEDHAERLDETGRDYATRVANAAARMDELIQDLLEYARLGRDEVPLEPVALAPVVSRVLSQLAPAADAGGASIEVVEPLPAVHGNPTVLVQVLANLVENALKYVAEGVRPRIRIRAEERGARVRIWVEDNGIGIAPEHHRRIFEVFQRLHGVTQYSGTGIGLAVVRKGVERMGGSIGLESAPGEGSRFWFELKRAE